MSFNNDDEGDGLAALFGGITPQAAPADDVPGPRRAAPQPAEPTPPAAPPAAPPPIEYPTYTAPPVAPPPYSAPPSYAPPAYAPPAYAPPPPAAPPYSPPPAAAPTPWPDAAPQYPGLAPRDEAPAPPPYSPPPPAPPAFDAPPASPAPPTFDAPAPAPAAPPADDFPTPAAATSRPAWEPLPPGGPPSAAPASFPPPAFPPPAFPPPAFPAPAAAPLPAAEPYRGLQPSPPAYPPTAQYPTGAEPFGAQPPGPALSEPPAPTGFDALGLGSGYSGTALPSDAPPTVDPAADERDRSWSSGDAQPSASAPVLRSDAPPPATVFPSGPLLPASGDPVEAPDHLERATTGERLGLVLAVLTGPIGLIVAIVSAVRGARRRGWLIGVARASLVLGVISTIAFGLGGVALWELRVQQMQFDRLASASAEFCAAGTENPALVTAPLLGWPAPGATISESLTLMQEWTTRWTDLAATSPEELRVGIELLAQAGTTIADSVTQSRAIDDAANQAAISATATQSGVAEWFQTYCAVP